MSTPIITIDGLSKCYAISTKRDDQHKEPYRTLSEDLLRLPKRLLRYACGQRAEHREEFWALKDVCFEIQQGEVLGIVGHNGAGKSTLLKILSRITEPTTGRVEICGRLASLLEVGTGFHPELTGRENIYLNGSILGMTRTEIRRSFEEIVDFAGVERFLDTPVKRYSSGMYVRLAFAVAAHLEPEILVVDEVLAVGDASFQAKCLGRIKSVAKSGRTIIFVSHNVNALASTCSRAVWLKNGRMLASGGVQEILSQYAADATQAAETNRNNGLLFEPIPISRTLMVNNVSLSPPAVDQGADLLSTIEIQATAKTNCKELCLIVYDAIGVRVGVLDFRKLGIISIKDNTTFECRIRNIRLVEGIYTVSIYGIADGEVLAEKQIFSFEVKQSGSFVSLYPVQHRGTIDFEWETTQHDNNMVESTSKCD